MGSDLCQKVFALFDYVTTFFSSDRDNAYNSKISDRQKKARFGG